MTLRVLAVDDSATMRQSVALTLKQDDMEVMTADDGVDALSKVSAGFQADVVITDVNMPNMDGITLTAELRKVESYAKIPIIILTTESQAEKKQAGKSAGATGWVIKPFQPDQLVAIVKKVAGK